VTVQRLAAAAALALTLSLAATAPAAAERAAEVRELARQAHRDPAALERLREVETVDGRPADFERALDGAEGEELSRRLDVIESSAGNVDQVTPPLTGDGAQRQARRIQESDRYRPDDPPRPLAGLLRRIGELLEPITNPFGNVLGAIFDNPWGVAGVALLIVVVVGIITSRLIRRGARATAFRLDGTGGTGLAVDPRTADPAALEREADAAERAGDFDRAIRLRFLAGVLRLDRAGVIRYRASVTTGELVRTIRSSAFRPLARIFDEVAYGGRQPGQAELERAKADWPRVLEEARR